MDFIDCSVHLSAESTSKTVKRQLSKWSYI